MFRNVVKNYPKGAEGVVKMFNKNERHKILLYVSEHSKTQNLTQTPNKYQTNSRFFKLLHFGTTFEHTRKNK